MEIYHFFSFSSLHFAANLHLSEVTIDCIFAEMHRDGGSGLAPWPARLTTPPPRLADLYVTADTFEKDTVS
jgi:hypothetical protein